MGGGDFSFDAAFRSLTGHAPLSWQRRLFEEHFAVFDPSDPGKDTLPHALDIPTGLGKTSVMAIWLLARAHSNDAVRRKIPRRLVYVVDRRAVVDQATSAAEKLRKSLEGEYALKQRLGLSEKTSLPISTLRGQHVDNQDWLADPAAPAIIVGTVDMIGSRLLFSGYGVSPKTRPFHAGFLGADTLVVLDEAHLVPPFEALIKAVANDEALGSRVVEKEVVPRFRMLSLSATGASYNAGADRIFRLKTEDRDDKVVEARLNAPKRLSISEIAETRALVPELAKRAWALGTEPHAARVLVYCDSRQTALDVQKAIGRWRRRRKSIRICLWVRGGCMNGRSCSTGCRIMAFPANLKMVRRAARKVLQRRHF
jgi:CRISPR-associated endonuclease/helicase Cas3